MNFTKEDYQNKYGYDYDHMKEILIKMGGKVSDNNENVINILKDQGTLPEKRGGNVWVFKGHTYDFICIRYKALKFSDIKSLLKLLKIESLPARNPLRRVLVKMYMKDKISKDEFYGCVRNNHKKSQKVSEKPQSYKWLKHQPNWGRTRKGSGNIYTTWSSYTANKMYDYIQELGNPKGLFIKEDDWEPKARLVVMDYYHDFDGVKEKLRKVETLREIGLYIQRQRFGNAFANEVVKRIELLPEEEWTIENVEKIINETRNPKPKRLYAPIDYDEGDKLLHEIKCKKENVSDFEKDQIQRRTWLKQAYRRMRVPIPDWIDDVVIKDYTAFDQIPNLGLWFRTKSNRGRFLLLDDKLYDIASNYIKTHGFIKGFFTGKRRTVNNNGGALYIMDNCKYENTHELIELLKESL